MKTLNLSVRKFFSHDLFSAMMALAIGLLVVTSPATIAAEKSTKSPSIASQQAEVKVNINKASVIDLTNLKGVGEKKAMAIIEYRNTVGKFTSVEQLMEVKGIGKSTLEKNRKNISL